MVSENMTIKTRLTYSFEELTIDSHTPHTHVTASELTFLVVLNSELVCWYVGFQFPSKVHQIDIFLMNEPLIYSFTANLYIHVSLNSSSD